MKLVAHSTPESLPDTFSEMQFVLKIRIPCGICFLIKWTPKWAKKDVSVAQNRLSGIWLRFSFTRYDPSIVVHLVYFYYGLVKAGSFVACEYGEARENQQQKSIKRLAHIWSLNFCVSASISFCLFTRRRHRGSVPFSSVRLGPESGPSSQSAEITSASQFTWVLSVIFYLRKLEAGAALGLPASPPEPAAQPGGNSQARPSPSRRQQLGFSTRLHVYSLERERVGAARVFWGLDVTVRKPTQH